MKYCKDNYCLHGTSIEYKEKLVDAMNYQEYLDKIYAFLDEHKPISADGDSMVHYTLMNMKRMERWNKTVMLREDIRDYFAGIEMGIEFLVITEAWCGDAAHVLPVVQKLVDTNPNFTMKTLLRDENPEIMDKYLTNGNRSIPVIIGLQKVGDEYIEMFKWGPKPMPLMDMLHDYKKGVLNVSQGVFLKQSQMWYNTDKTETIQEELLDLVKKAVEI